MTTITVKTKRWGNSIGIILPSETVSSRNIGENEDLDIIILKNSRKALRETFGLLKGKFKKSAQEMKNELRRELY